MQSREVRSCFSTGPYQTGSLTLCQIAILIFSLPGFVVIDLTMRIDSPRVAAATYPDQVCSAEIYTNADPLRYVELEMLGPLITMKVGDRVDRTSTSTLTRPTTPGPVARSRKVDGQVTGRLDGSPPHRHSAKLSKSRSIPQAAQSRWRFRVSARTSLAITTFSAT
jgi:hypothetical protein